VTRRRIYVETLQAVLPGMRSKIIIDEKTRSILPFLNLDSQKLASQKLDSQKLDSQKLDSQKEAAQ